MFFQQRDVVKFANVSTLAGESVIRRNQAAKVDSYLCLRAALVDKARLPLYCFSRFLWRNHVRGAMPRMNSSGENASFYSCVVQSLVQEASWKDSKSHGGFVIDAG